MKRTPLYEQHVRDASAVINLKGFARAMQYVGHVREHRADRGVARRVGDGGEDLSGRGLAVPVEDVHDLPLPPGQVRERLFGSHSGCPPRWDCSAKNLASAVFLASLAKQYDGPGLRFRGFGKR